MRRIVAVLIALTALTSGIRAQDAKERTIPFEGAEVFCHILFHENLQPIMMKDLNNDPSDTILIHFGNPLGLHPSASIRFRQQGGNLLVITDYTYQDGALGVAIRGLRVTQPLDSAYGSPECPWLPSAGGGDHPLFHSLRKGIATNRPSHVFSPNMIMPPMPGAPPPANPLGLQPLLRFSPEAIRADGRALRFGWAYMMGSPKDAPPSGRVLVIAGQGMFMNGMMLQSDNDNFDFAVNVVRWLRERPDGKARTKALFMVDGKIVSDFNMNLSPPAVPSQPQIPVPPVKALNRLIRGMEDEQMFHKILHGMMGDHVERVVGILIALATFGLVIYGAKKLLEGRVQRETAVPVMVGVVAATAPTLTRGQQRHLALQQQADAASPAAQLVRSWLRTEFGVQPETWPAGAVVALEAGGTFWSRWLMQRRADWVLSIARTSKPVTRRDFAAVVAALPKLSQSAQAGQLALLVDGKNVRHGSG